MSLIYEQYAYTKGTYTYVSEKSKKNASRQPQSVLLLKFRKFYKIKLVCKRFFERMKKMKMFNQHLIIFLHKTRFGSNPWYAALSFIYYYFKKMFYYIEFWRY